MYENALVVELRKRSLLVTSQQKIAVYYADEIVGEYYADLIVEEKVILELKAVETLLPQHEAQLLNYLRATPYEVGLLLNFGPKPKHLRKSFDNNRKKMTWRP